VQPRGLDTEDKAEPEGGDAGQDNDEPQDPRHSLAREIQALLPLLPDLIDLGQHLAKERLLRGVIYFEDLNSSDQSIEVVLRDRAAFALGHCLPIIGGHRIRILHHQLPDLPLSGLAKRAAELYEVVEVDRFILHGIIGGDVLVPQCDNHKPSDYRINDSHHRAQEASHVIMLPAG
jgi:hypothetical protein